MGETGPSVPLKNCNPLLCERCAVIPFGDLSQGSYSGDPSTFPCWKIGTYDYIQTSRCPFCEIVARVLQQVLALRKEILDLSWPVELHWHHDHLIVRPFGHYHKIYFTAGAKATLCLAKHQMEMFISEQYLRRCAEKCRLTHQQTGLNRFGPYDTYKLSEGGGERLLPGNLRMIDLEQMCIVNAPVDCDYCALSYMWGNSNDNRLLLEKNMQHILGVPGALMSSETSERVPKTIRDAMTVVRAVGVRYLWVDSLCLIQDDEDDLAGCVDLMDCIYDGAFITIVAACGEDAHHGIPGIGGKPRHDIRALREVSPGIWMAPSFEVEVKLQFTKYNTRAWTMQEYRCARRLLIFVEDRVYFRCVGGCASDEDWVREYREPRSCDRPHPANRLTTGWIPSFGGFLLDYTKRSLTNETDILRAAAGLFRRTAGRAYFNGLPLEKNSLTFYRADISEKSARRNRFPSYSWAGWKMQSRMQADGGSLHYHFSPDPCSSSNWAVRTTNGQYMWLNPDASLEPLSDEAHQIYERNYPNLPYEILFIEADVLQLEVRAAEHRSWGLHLARRVTHELRDHDGSWCGEVMLDMDDEAECASGFQEFALICGATQEVIGTKSSFDYTKALLLKRIGLVSERRGLGLIDKRSHCWQTYLKNRAESGPSHRYPVIALG